MKKSMIIFVLFISLSLFLNAQTESKTIRKPCYDVNLSKSQRDNRSNNVPNLIDFQGRLTDDNGNAVNGTVNITFSIYDVDTGGTALWSESQAVDVTEGLFNVTLGNITPLDESYFISPDRWIGILVETDNEMSPRTRITSVPYALQSGTSTPDDDWTIDGDNVYHETGNVGIGTTTPDEELSVVGKVRASYNADETKYIEIFHGSSHANINWLGSGDLNIKKITALLLVLIRMETWELALRISNPIS